MNTTTSLFECGASLSERAHYQKDDNDNNDNNDHSNSNLKQEEEEMIFLNKTTTKNPFTSTTSSAFTTTSSSSSSWLKSITTIDELRFRIASDVYTTTNSSSSLARTTTSTTTSPSWTTFTSPFKNYLSSKERTTESQSSSSSSSLNKYYQLPLIYCDQTASNRCVTSIEQYIQQNCLPYLGNTHTNTSITGSQSTAFCAEARQLVAEITNSKITGKASLDTVLFAGNGATGAVQLLIDCLGLHHHHHEQQDRRPVVFCGPYEHHSNLVPWRESGCEIVMIPETTSSNQGEIDMIVFEQLLSSTKYKNRILKIGAFTAASNVTGTICNDNEICYLLHKYGGLAFFDYATAAPYLSMNMNPTTSTSTTTTTNTNNTLHHDPSLIAKDAIFWSPHKLLGGVGGPGILIMKKHLIHQENPPNRSGGGTVFYVTHTHHRFLSNRIERYEGGTPNVMGIIRVGLACVMKRDIEQTYIRLAQQQQQQQTLLEQETNEGKNRKGETNQQLLLSRPYPKTLMEYEFQTHTHVSSILRDTAPNLVLLGVTTRHKDENDDKIMNDHHPHLPIFSFLIQCGARFLHYNYVCAILNDVFGIQSRGGCQCAGPYSQRLLGLTTTTTTTNTTTSTSSTEDDGPLVVEVPNQSNQEIEHALIHYKERAELLRPGYSRLSLPFKGLYAEEVEYVIKALQWTSKHAWKLLCQYRCNHRTGEWRHKIRQGAPLGKRERKWLSHYSPFNPQQHQDEHEMTTESNQQQSLSSSSSNNNNNSSILADTLKQADALLVAAQSDQSSIVQTMKMNEGGDDGASLEHLRWYVYPKDVASYVSQGLDEVPGTHDRNKLLGPIRPLVWFPNNSGSGNGDVSGSIGSAISAINDNDQKEVQTGTSLTRQNPQGSPMDAQGLAHEAEEKKDNNEQQLPSTLTELSLLQKDGPIMHSFQDGEHAGEALLDDIEAGFDDGELSEECQVFDPSSDSWVSVATFLQSMGRLETVTSSKVLDMGVTAGDVAETPKPTAVARPPKTASQVAEKEPGHLDEKNLKKKPQRDSSTWGQGTFSPGVVAPFAVGAPVPKQDKNVDAMTQNPSDPSTNSKRKKSRHIKPPAKMMRAVTQAIIQWDMVEEGDKLLLGLSGGKDSLSLLHVLLEFQKKLPIKFEIEVCTIDPLTPSFDPSSLIPYVESLGLKYHYIRDNIVDRATNAGKDGTMVSSLCAYCARMKRGALYSTARNAGCNKLVLAQHLDDLAESFMMSVMHNGFLRTMKAHYKINAGDLSVIRPLAYCRESLMTDFAKSANLPVINENCPACFEEPKERARIKKLLSREETLYPNFYDNIRRSLLPLMHDDLSDLLRSYTEETVAKSRKDQKGASKANGQKCRRGGKRVGLPEKRSLGNSEKEEKKKVIEVAKDAREAPKEAMNLADASEEQLLRELARRRAERFRLAGSKKQRDNDGDPTGQVCSLNGGKGSIPCYELME